MTTAVCFDLDGTLVRYDPPYGELLSATLADHLGAAPEAVIDAYDEAFFEAFEALDPAPYETGARAALATGTDAVADGDIADLARALREREVGAATVPAATRDCLEDLAADGDVTLAVVTDGVGDQQRAKLAGVDLANVVDEVIVSYEVGGHKVDGAPYEAARERVEADEYVMVGDSYEADVEAAREAGFVPIHYEDRETDLFAVLRTML